jgi:hypothetical protein
LPRDVRPGIQGFIPWPSMRPGSSRRRIRNRPFGGRQAARHGRRSGVVADLACRHHEPVQAVFRVRDGVQVGVQHTLRSPEAPAAPVAGPLFRPQVRSRTVRPEIRRARCPAGHNASDVPKGMMTTLSWPPSEAGPPSSGRRLRCRTTATAATTGCTGCTGSRADHVPGLHHTTATRCDWTGSSRPAHADPQPAACNDPRTRPTGTAPSAHRSAAKDRPSPPRQSGQVKHTPKAASGRAAGPGDGDSRLGSEGRTTAWKKPRPSGSLRPPGKAGRSNPPG